ncbi:hypothetical protein TIFTF001_005206 [Ficus carica]|uniref:Uncharacterized protein n=1 Tax=Ficus carica TaxID=3494 RepID=A0AA88A0Q3_FICCA|nr:hypothetical protein TIFTF001_005206 [Ficus carica]
MWSSVIKIHSIVSQGNHRDLRCNLVILRCCNFIFSDNDWAGGGNGGCKDLVFKSKKLRGRLVGEVKRESRRSQSRHLCNSCRISTLPAKEKLASVCDRDFTAILAISSRFLRFLSSLFHGSDRAGEGGGYWSQSGNSGDAPMSTSS